MSGLFLLRNSGNALLTIPADPATIENQRIYLKFK